LSIELQKTNYKQIAVIPVESLKILEGNKKLVNWVSVIKTKEFGWWFQNDIKKSNRKYDHQMLWYQKNKKQTLKKTKLESERTFFSALYLCKTPYSHYPHKKICNPSASIYSSLNSIIMTTTKNKFRFGECFYKCSLPKKMRVYFLYLKKMLNNEICPDF